MFTINHALEDAVNEADGRYLNSREMMPLEQYLQSFENRLTAYESLRDHAEALVLEALMNMNQAYPDLIRQHGARCKYDMSEVLRYIGASILRDDETYFKEEMLSWLDTILVSMRRQEHCATAYRLLEKSVIQHLPEKSANQVRPYLELVVQVLESHA